MDYKKCTAPTNDPKIVLKEKKSKFEINNSKRLLVSKVSVDGCLIDDEREKCDWIVSIDLEGLKKALFIELKGCGLEKAISQLKSTIKHTRDKYGDYTKECYAVTTRVPKHGSTMGKLKKDFFKQTNATLSVKNLKAEVKI